MKILKNADHLANIVPLDIYPLVVALQKFYVVIESCFKTVLNPNNDKAIEAFVIAYKATELTVTTKVRNKHKQTFIRLQEYYLILGPHCGGSCRSLVQKRKERSGTQF